MYKWKVCPIQGRQLKDVREEDIYGDFRFCNTYRGGGGYDQFPKIAKKRGLTCDGDMGLQFVVQLFGCPLDCYYCYVTRDGVFGNYKEYTTEELVGSYNKACFTKNAGVFHLMGGAPALAHRQWPELLDALPETTIFHSDLMLCEREYYLPALKKSNRDNALYAVDIKGVNPEDWYRNTGRKLDERQFWFNFYCVVDSGINFYLVFTNPDPEELERFKEFIVNRFGDWILNDHFVIDLIEYEALK
jgi:pyruvate-formate lyase-activating enzyme